MSSSESNDELHCPQCGAMLAAKADSCWLCQGRATFAGVDALRPDPVQPPPIVEPRAAYQFGISTLLLIMTLFAVLCGVLSMSPGLGIVLAIVATPALVRTGMTAVRRKVRGRPMTVPEKLGTFAGSVGVVMIIGVGAGAAFLATCFTGLVGGAATTSLWNEGYTPMILGLITGVVLGGIAGLYAGYRLIRRFWPRKD